MAPETATGTWQLDATGPAAYEKHLVPRLFDPWAADLVQATNVGHGHHVLDVACGTGIVARHAARRVGSQGEVTGIDLNPAMLAAARELADGSIAWREASADELPFPDETFDVVLCQQGLQFFGDRPAALAEMRRVAKPGGRLGVSTGRGIDHQPGYRHVIDSLTRHVGVEAGEIISSPHALGDSEELRSLVADAGLQDVHLHFVVLPLRFPSAEDLLRAESSSSPLGNLVDRLDADVREELVEDLTRRLAPHTDDEGVIFPFESNVITAAR